jgi:hypothetical protein
VWDELQGLSADEIVSRFPHLTMADVYAALSYYWDHREEIQRQMQEETDFVERLPTAASSSQTILPFCACTTRVSNTRGSLTATSKVGRSARMIRALELIWEILDPDEMRTG